MRELIAQWRRKAASGEVSPDAADHLKICADELEEAWHDDKHQAAWLTDGSCPICTREMAGEDDPA